LILGVVAAAECQIGRINIAPGGRLLLYTDGITETMSPSEEPFGVERLINILTRHCDQSGESIIETICSLVELLRDGADQEDDVTALVVARDMEKGD